MLLAPFPAVLCIINLSFCSTGLLSWSYSSLWQSSPVCAIARAHLKLSELIRQAISTVYDSVIKVGRRVRVSYIRP